MQGCCGLWLLSVEMLLPSFMLQKVWEHFIATMIERNPAEVQINVLTGLRHSKRL